MRYIANHDEVRKIVRLLERNVFHKTFNSEKLKQCENASRYIRKRSEQIDHLK